MAISYESFLSTEVFRIEGPQGRLFYVHGALLSKRSQVLAVDVNGEMIEAKTKQIKIRAIDDDIDDDTVMRFIEYAYTGDYTVPVPDTVLTSGKGGSQGCTGSTETASRQNGHSSLRHETNGWHDAGLPNQYETAADEVVEPVESEPEPELETLSDMWGAWAPRPKKVSGRDLKKQLRNRRWCVDVELPEEVKIHSMVIKKNDPWNLFCNKALVSTGEPWEPRSQMDDEDFTNIMLCHAQLYVFSSRWECEGLRDLVLQKLRLQLARYSVSAKRITEIVALIQYTYAHTQDYSSGSIDTLRDLVIDFTVCHIEVIEPDEDFRTLLTGSNDVGKDVMRKLMKRIS